MATPTIQSIVEMLARGLSPGALAIIAGVSVFLITIIWAIARYGRLKLELEL